MKLNKLRSFIYLDRELVKEFLSQLDEGYYDSEKIKDDSSERTIEQNASSEFGRLYEQLTSQGLEKSELCKDSEWGDIDAGDIIEIDISVSVNLLTTLLSNPMYRAMMLAEQSPADVQQLDNILGKDLTVTARPTNSGQYGFIMDLKSKALLKPDGLEGELTILCKIHGS